MEEERHVSPVRSGRSQSFRGTYYARLGMSVGSSSGSTNSGSLSGSSSSHVESRSNPIPIFSAAAGRELDLFDGIGAMSAPVSAKDVFDRDELMLHENLYTRKR